MSGDGPLIFIVAGEPSGDALGARLMAALKERTQGAVRFAGIGGERMAGEGLDSLLPIRELSVMGYLEVVPKIPRILGHIRKTGLTSPSVGQPLSTGEYTNRGNRHQQGHTTPIVVPTCSGSASPPYRSW